MSNIEFATVAQVYTAPVKSFQPLFPAEELRIGENGVIGDRVGMLVEAPKPEAVKENDPLTARYQPVTLRKDRHLVKLAAGFDFNTEAIILHDGSSELVVPKAEDVVENRLDVRLWTWGGVAVDQGDRVAKFLSDRVGRDVRMVRLSDEEPRFVENNPELGQLGLADGYTTTIGSVESLQLLNQQLMRMGSKPISLHNIRTTLLLAGLKMPEAGNLPGLSCPEDYIKRIIVGRGTDELELTPEKGCGRCREPGMPLDYDEKLIPVLAALKAMGRHGRHVDTERFGDGPELFFTQNAVARFLIELAQGAHVSLRRGDQVRVEYTSMPNWLPL